MRSTVRILLIISRKIFMVREVHAAAFEYDYYLGGSDDPQSSLCILLRGKRWSITEMLRLAVGIIWKVINVIQNPAFCIAVDVYWLTRVYERVVMQFERMRASCIQSCVEFGPKVLLLNIFRILSKSAFFWKYGYVGSVEDRNIIQET